MAPSWPSLSSAKRYLPVSETPVLPTQTDPASPASAALPLALQRYLPAHLWLQLTEQGPRRGLLLNALEQVRSLRYLLGTYLPAPLVQDLARRPAPGQVHGDLLDGTLLFADVSGFTALSERLQEESAEEGAEQLTQAINRYFECALQILAWSGGTLLKFAGDALLAYFPLQAGGEQAHWAARAGQRMLRAVATSPPFPTRAGPVALRVKIGLASGPFLAAHVGSARRMEYVLLGETVARTMAAEGAAAAGQLVVDAATTAALDPATCTEQVPGYYAVQLPTAEEMGDFEIKAEPRRARGGAAWLADTAEILSDIAETLRQIESLLPYLPPELVDRIVAHAGLRQVESEFRPTTVLFANFCGPDILLSATPTPAEAEQAARLLNEYFSAAEQAIACYGGALARVDPFKQGSKMLVLFGALAAHEDDPQRAVHAALAMNQEVAALSERWRRLLPASSRAAPPLQQRIGLTQGRTFAGQAGTPVRREYTVMGDDVNLAARLMAAAQPGQVLISQSLYQAVREHFQIGALPPIRVKGKSQPVPVYQVDRPRDNRPAGRSGRYGPLLGRTAELARARAVLQRALAGQGSTLTIRGPAGVGKSHLASALAGEAFDLGARVYTAECHSYTAAAPYAPWIALLQAIAGSLGDAPPQARGEQFARLLAGLHLERAGGPLFELLGLPAPALPEQWPQPAAAAPAEARPSLFERLDRQVAAHPESAVNLWELTRERGAGADRPLWQRLEVRVADREEARLAAAIAGLLEAMAEQAPLMLVIENAQWLDASSRRLLRTLGSRLPTQPILVLVVQRHEGRAPAGAGPSLSLRPLGRTGTAALLENLLGQSLAAAGRSTLVRTVHERSGGNPLYVEEIVRLWQQRGGPTGPAALQAVLQSARTLQEMVLSRLDGLAHGPRGAARSASVVGDEFAPIDIATLLDEPAGESTLVGYLGEAAAARLIVPLEERGTRYAFQPPLLRELIYESLPFARRRELHARLAGAIEVRHAGDLAGQAELLAYHYGRAGDDLMAACYLLLSGHNAQQRYAYLQATACYGRALALLDRLPESTPNWAALRAQGHEGQGDVALLSGDFAAAVAAYGTAQALLAGATPAAAGARPAASPGAAPIGEAEARLLVKLALVLPTQGQAEAAEASVGRAWASAPLAGDLAPAATMAWLLWRRGAPEAGAWIEAAAMLVAARADRWMAGVATLLRDLAGEWSAVLPAYQSLDRPAGVVLAACRLGDQRLARGDLAAARSLYGQAAALAGAENDTSGLALARYRLAEAAARAGEPAAAEAGLQEARALLRLAGSGLDDARGLLRQALAALRAGRAGPWPAWRWQHYDDALRIAILFRP